MPSETTTPSAAVRAKSPALALAFHDLPYRGIPKMCNSGHLPVLLDRLWKLSKGDGQARYRINQMRQDYRLMRAALSRLIDSLEQVRELATGEPVPTLDDLIAEVQNARVQDARAQNAQRRARPAAKIDAKAVLRAIDKAKGAGQ